jgi:AcrR family transcriptional regulator
MVRKNNPEQTRTQILEMACMLIHQHGFKGMRIDEVAEKTELTKGAIYYHFPNKKALGYAVIDDLLRQQFKAFWSDSLQQPGLPVEVISASFKNMGQNVDECDLEVGCPLTNLGSEMSFEDEGFRLRINKVFDEWAESIEALLEKGKQDGNVREDVDPKKTSQFLVASFQGIQCSAKHCKDLNRFSDGLDYICKLVNSLSA